MSGVFFRQVMSAVQEEGGTPSASTAQKIVTSALASQSNVARLAFRLPLVPLNESALVTTHSHGPDALAPMLARALAWGLCPRRLPRVAKGRGRAPLHEGGARGSRGRGGEAHGEPLSTAIQRRERHRAGPTGSDGDAGGRDKGGAAAGVLVVFRSSRPGRGRRGLRGRVWAHGHRG